MWREGQSTTWVASVGPAQRNTKLVTSPYLRIDARGRSIPMAARSLGGPGPAHAVPWERERAVAFGMGMGMPHGRGRGPAALHRLHFAARTASLHRFDSSRQRTTSHLADGFPKGEMPRAALALALRPYRLEARTGKDRRKKSLWEFQPPTGAPTTATARPSPSECPTL